MGKSELAIKFANSNIDDFSIVWQFHADSPELLEDGYRRLAKELYIPLERDWSLDRIKRTTHGFLQGNQFDKPWLLIFDNAEEKIMDSDLPQEGGCVLITSRQYNVRNKREEHIHVEPFTLEEAINLLSQITKEKASNEMEQLAKDLDYFPFVLNQVARYISNTNITIAEYRKLYNDPKNTPASGEDRYNHTLQNVWRITWNRIKKDSPEGYEWLQMISYLAPNPIPEEWLQIWVRQKIRDTFVERIWEEKFWDDSNDGHRRLEIAISSTLNNYDIIRSNREHHTFSIHRLHQISLQSIIDKDEGQLIIEKTLRFIDEYVKDLEIEQPEKGKNAIKKIDALIPHVMYMYKNNIPREKSIINKILDMLVVFKGSPPQYQLDRILNPLIAAYEQNGKTLFEEYKYIEAGLSFEKARQLYLHIDGSKNSDQYALMIYNIGIVKRYEGKTKEAKAYYKEVLQIWKQINDPRRDSTVRLIQEEIDILDAYEAYQNGENLLLEGRCREATLFFEKARKLYLQILGNKNSDQYAETTYDIGRAKHKEGKLKEAKAYYKEALQIWKQINDPRRDSTVRVVQVQIDTLDAHEAHQNGENLLLEGRCREATLFFEKARELYLQIKNSDQYAETTYDIGRAKYKEGKLKKAKAYYKEALQIWKQIQIDNPMVRDSDVRLVQVQIDTLDAYENGRMLFDGGKYTEAELSFKKARELYFQMHGNKNSDGYAITTYHIGRIKYKEGKSKEAKAYYNEALEIWKQINDPGRDSDMRLVQEQIAIIEREEQWCMIQ